MSTFCFKVSIKCGNKVIPITKRSRIQPRIIDWYMERFEFLAVFYKIEIISLSFNYEEGCFILKYKPDLKKGFEDEPYMDEMLADPDDDGNYPLNAYGTDCLVIGEIC